MTSLNPAQDDSRVGFILQEVCLGIDKAVEAERHLRSRIFTQEMSYGSRRNPEELEADRKALKATREFAGLCSAIVREAGDVCDSLGDTNPVAPVLLRKSYARLRFMGTLAHI